MLWRLVGYDKGGNTSEEELVHLVALEKEQQPSEKFSREDLGKPKFQFRWEVGVLYGKAEGRRELLAVPSTTSPAVGEASTSWSVLFSASV